MNQQVTTLLAVALGGVIAAGTQFAAAAINERRERRKRWHDQRHALYAEVLAQMLPAIRWIDDTTQALTSGVQTDPGFEIVTWSRQMDPLLSSINLVGSEAVIRETYSMQMIVAARGHLLHAVLEGEQPFSAIEPALAPLDEVLDDLVTELVNVMRVDLVS